MASKDDVSNDTIMNTIGEDYHTYAHIIHKPMNGLVDAKMSDDALKSNICNFGTHIRAQ